MADSETFRTERLAVVVHADRIEVRESAPNAKGWEVLVPASTKTIFFTSLTHVQEEGSNLGWLLTHKPGENKRTLVLHTADGGLHLLQLFPGQIEMVRDTILKFRSHFLAAQRSSPQAAAPHQPQSPLPAEPRRVTCSRCNNPVIARDLVAHLASCSPPQPSRAEQAATPSQSAVPQLFCPWCGGELPGRFEKCANCGSTIAWAADGKVFKSSEEAQKHEQELELRAQAEHSQRSEKIISIVNMLRSASDEANVMLKEVSQVENGRGGTVPDGKDWQALKKKVDQSLQVADSCRTESASWSTQSDIDPNFLRLLGQFRAAYDKLKSTRELVAVETRIASEKAAAPPPAQAHAAAGSAKSPGGRQPRKPNVCPVCDTSLAMSNDQCYRCRGELFWAADATAWSSIEEAKEHAAWYLEQEIAAAKLEMTAAIQEATPLRTSLRQTSGSDLTAEQHQQLARLRHIVDRGLQSNARAEIMWIETIADATDYCPELLPAYEALIGLRDFAEMVASRRGEATKPAAVPITTSKPAPVAEPAQPKAVAQESPPLDELWRWMLTASACIATADGKLGGREVAAIAGALVESGCELAGETLQTEIVATCKRIHAEGVEKVAANLCDAVRGAGDGDASRRILECVKRVSNADGIAGARETKLADYFLSRLKP
jgi:hypothetical protein